MSAILITGQTVTTTLVNLRSGVPNTNAPVVRKLAAGTPITVQAIVAGESVQGNAQWFLTDENAYVWSGGCAPFSASTPSPIVPSGAGDAPNVVDLAHGDRVASFGQARAAGVIGIIHKATTGQSGQDGTYDDRRRDALAAGLLWGAYHWGTAAPIDAQVENFLDTAAPDDNTLVALDFETTPGNQMTLDGAREFLQGIQDRLGRRAVLYSGDVIKSALSSSVDPFFGAHRLWLCQYGTRPKVQASWSSFWLWQYTDGTAGPGPYSVPGLPGDDKNHLDCNHFMGTEDQLRAQWAS